MIEPIEVGDLVVHNSEIGWVLRQHEKNIVFWIVEWSNGDKSPEHESAIKENKLAAKKLLTR